MTARRLPTANNPAHMAIISVIINSMDSARYLSISCFWPLAIIWVIRGIITVPKEAAQEVLNQMVEAGIKAIWNFAPAPLRAPKDVVLKTEDLAASLAMLAGKIYHTER